jgi:hypothetical protein
VLKKLDDREGARTALRRALRIFEEVLSRDQDAQTVRENLAMTEHPVSDNTFTAEEFFVRTRQK